MSTTVIGLFDSADEANELRQKLVQSGLLAEQIKVHPAAGSSSSTTTTGTSGNRHHDQSWWESLKEVFTGGDDDDDDTADEGTRVSADHYAEGVRRGGTVVRVEAPDNQVEAVAILMRQYNAADVDRRAADWRQSGWKGYDVNARSFSDEEIAAERARYSAGTTQNRQQTPAGQQSVAVPVVEEQLAVGKRRVNSGGVRILRRTTERPVEANVHLREERVNVERHRVDRPLTPAEANAAMKDQSVEVTTTSEQAVVAKQAKVVEEVVVNKTAQERQETVRGTVKRTDVEVERTPGQDAASRTDKTSGASTDRTQEKNRQP